MHQLLSNQLEPNHQSPVSSLIKPQSLTNQTARSPSGVPATGSLRLLGGLVPSLETRARESGGSGVALSLAGAVMEMAGVMGSSVGRTAGLVRGSGEDGSGVQRGTWVMPSSSSCFR